MADKIGDAFIEIRAPLDSLKQDLSKATTDVKKAASSMQESMTKALSTIGTAAAAVSSVLVKLAKDTAAMDDAAKKAGLSVESYQRLSYAFEKAGASAGTMDRALAIFTKRLSDVERGSVEARESFSKLEQMVGHGVLGSNRQETFTNVIVALQEINNETERAKLAMDIFGKSGAELLAVLSEEPQAFKKSLSEITVVSKESAQAWADFDDTLQRIQETAKNTFTNALAPLIQTFNSMPVGIQDATVSIIALTTVFGTATAAASLLGVSLAPLLIVIAKITAAVTAAYAAWEGLKSLWDKVTTDAAKPLQDSSEKTQQVLKIEEENVESLTGAYDSLVKMIRTLGFAKKDVAAIDTAITPKKISDTPLSSSATTLGEDLGSKIGKVASVSFTKDFANGIRISKMDDLNNFGDVIRNAFEGALVNQVNANLEVLTNAFFGLIPSKAANTGAESGNALAAGMLAGASTLPSQFDSIFSSIGSSFGSLVDWMGSSLSSLFSGIGSAIGGIGSGIGGLFEGLFGGFFAEGGNPPIGKISVVGEKGPELFVPHSAGTIIPNDALGGTSEQIIINQNFNVSTGVAQTVRAEILGLMPHIEAQTTAAVLDRTRRGGSFSAGIRGGR